MSTPYTLTLTPISLNCEAIYGIHVRDENGELVHEDRSDLRTAYLRARAIDRIRAVTKQEPNDLERFTLAKIAEDDAKIADAERNGPTAYRVESVSSDELSARIAKPQWLVNKIMVRGQPAVAGGARKALKTSLLVDLAVSLGAERQFLGSFFVPQKRRVLFMSAESGEWTIRETALRVAEPKRVPLTDCSVRWAFAVPQLSRAEHLDALRQHILEHGIEVAILDPLYLALLAGNTELNAGSMYDIGPLLMNVGKVCLDANCTPLLCHHTTKATSRVYEPPELEDLAWAGIAEFARQWLLIGRREPYDQGTGTHRLWLNVGGSAGFGGLWAVDVDEGVIDEYFAGRRWNVNVANAPEARKEQQEQAVARKQQTREADSEAKLTADKRKLMTVLNSYPDGVTVSFARGAVGMGAPRCQYIFDLLANDGQAEWADVPVAAGTKGKRMTPGIRRIKQTPD